MPRSQRFSRGRRRAQAAIEIVGLSSERPAELCAKTRPKADIDRRSSDCAKTWTKADIDYAHRYDEVIAQSRKILERSPEVNWSGRMRSTSTRCDSAIHYGIRCDGSPGSSRYGSGWGWIERSGAEAQNLFQDLRHKGVSRIRYRAGIDTRRIGGNDGDRRDQGRNSLILKGVSPVLMRAPRQPAPLQDWFRSTCAREDLLRLDRFSLLPNLLQYAITRMIGRMIRAFSADDVATLTPG